MGLCVISFVSKGKKPLAHDTFLKTVLFSAQEIQQRVLKNVRSGSIILFHNAAEHTPEALPGIIESLQAEGYTIVPVSQILLTGETYQDNTGRQWAK